jgi:hypothetical protein
MFSDEAGWLIVAVGGVALFVYLCIKIYKQREYYKVGNKKGEESQKGSDETSAQEKSSIDVFPLNPGEAVQFYLPLIEQMGEEFQLSDLYLLAREKNLPHPYLTISSFRQTGFLLPKGDGLFTWNHENLF